MNNAKRSILPSGDKRKVSGTFLHRACVFGGGGAHYHSVVVDSGRHCCHMQDSLLSTIIHMHYYHRATKRGDGMYVILFQINTLSALGKQRCWVFYKSAREAKPLLEQMKR